ncbi:MAG: type II secretion system protein [Planctomycetota bacterium]
MMIRPDTCRQKRSASRAAFTLLELLVVIAIITLIASLLIVAVNKGRTSARKAATQSLMNSMSQAMQRFKADHGYLPPQLGVERHLLTPFVASDPALSVEVVSNYYSITTPAEYLVGYGHHYEDGYGRVPGGGANTSWASESPPVGIRSPGADGVWNATRYGTGLLNERMSYGPGAARGSETNPYEFDKGQVYGPYLDLSDDRLLGGLTDTLDVVFPGDGAYDDSLPKVIVDSWDQPIRFYRQTYLPGSIGQSVRFSDRDGDGIHDPVGLETVVPLRPFDLAAASGIDARNFDGTYFNDADGDSTTSSELKSAEFAFLSAGPDQRIDDTKRRDDFNRDNIVEVGQ